MVKSIRLLLLILAFSGLGYGLSAAGDKIWVGLYLAENEPPPSEAKLAPDKLTHQLQEVFGFKHYQLLQADQIELRHEWEQWFMPRRDFFLRIEPLRDQPGQPRMIDYEIYKDGFIVAKGKYEPQDNTPLFINGPDFHTGRLILVLRTHPPRDESSDID